MGTITPRFKHTLNDSDTAKYMPYPAFNISPKNLTFAVRNN